MRAHLVNLRGFFRGGHEVSGQTGRHRLDVVERNTKQLSVLP